KSVQGAVMADWHKTHPVAGAQLAEHPEIGANNCGRADKPAERWPVRPEDHRHIASEIDSARSISVIVNVGGMQARLPAILPCPLRFRADQPDAGAAAVVMDFVGVAEQSFYVDFGEEFRRA